MLSVIVSKEGLEMHDLLDSSEVTIFYDGI